MSYKINEIRQIESLANKCGCNQYPYFDGFEFQGEKYTNGWVVLSEKGMHKLGTNNPRANIAAHWIDNYNNHCYSIRYYNTKNMYNHKWDSNILYLDNLDDYLESAAEIDYKNISATEILSLPKDELSYHLTRKSIAEGTYETNANAKHLFKDWEVPELVVGWIVFIIFFIGVFVFKDWLFQLVLRIIGGCIFGWWRQMKVMGLK